MKAIMISIKPKWCAKIMNSNKTIEVRKSKALASAIQKLINENGYVDIYVYCSKGKPYIAHATHLITGKYACIYDDDVSYEEHNLNGKVAFKFRCYKVEEIRFDDKEVQRKACLTEDELFDYLFVNEPYHEDMKNGYAIHISDLEIFDRPKELNEFYYSKEPKKELNIPKGWKQIITKAPQNFCYVEVEK